MATEGPGAMADVLSTAADLARIEGQILAKTFTLDLQRLISGVVWTVAMATLLVVAMLLVAIGIVLAIYFFYPTVPRWIVPLLLSGVFFAGAFFAWRLLIYNFHRTGGSIHRLKKIASQLSKGGDHELPSIEQQH